MNKLLLLVSLVRVGILSLCLAGCATIGQGAPVVSEQPVKTLREVVPVGGLKAVISEDGTTIHLEAKHVCGLQERRVVVKTTRVDNENRSAAADWGWGLVGLASGTTGAIMLADAKNVYPNDTTSSTYNPQGPDKARLYGAGLVALGAACLTVAVVDVARANGATENLQEITRAPVITNRDVPCSIAYADAKANARIGDKGFDIGKTDAKGILDVDLDQAIDPTYDPPLNGIITILVEGREAGQIDIAPLYKKREERAWRALKPLPCLEPTSPSACDSFKQFVSRYRSGPHSAQARKVIEAGQPKIRELEEAAAWSQLALAACSTGNAKDSPTDVDAACSRVETYVSKFGDGPHAKEAASALQKGKVRLGAIEAKRKQQAAQEEAKAKLQAAAEQRRREAEKRQQEAKERQAAEQAKAACRSDCRDGCVMGRYRRDALEACVRQCFKGRCFQQE